MARTRLGQILEHGTTVARVVRRSPPHWQFVLATLGFFALAVFVALLVTTGRLLVSGPPLVVVAAFLAWVVALWLVTRPTGGDDVFGEMTGISLDPRHVRVAFVVLVVVLAAPVAVSGYAASTGGGNPNVASALPLDAGTPDGTAAGNNSPTATAATAARTTAAAGDDDTRTTATTGSGTQTAPIGNATRNDRARNETPVEDVTFYTVQGNEQGSKTAGVYAVDTKTKELVWKHDSYYTKYFDVDPIGDDKILFTVHVTPDRFTEDGFSWRAIVMNWRTGEVVESFDVPPDTHDVDYIGNGQYVVASKLQKRLQAPWREVLRRNDWTGQDRAIIGHQIYVYDSNADQIVWEYNFAEHFPPTAGDGIDEDYTHLNDVDAVDNGTKFLVSPREFDRVMLINRSTKEVEWTLGEEDNYDILHEQHNPELLSEDPPTVLVADSENDRVVEYELTDDGWQRTWLYQGDLAWPRDADRLPNGNTLIADSGGGRLLEVAPNGTVVWELDVGFSVYDVERLQYGDEPGGPTMNEIRAGALERDGTGGGDGASGDGGSGTATDGTVVADVEEIPPSSLYLSTQLVDRTEEYYRLSRWVLPQWVTELDFLLLHALVLVLLLWAHYEWVLWRSRRRSA